MCRASMESRLLIDTAYREAQFGCGVLGHTVGLSILFQRKLYKPWAKVPAIFHTCPVTSPALISQTYSYLPCQLQSPESAPICPTSSNMYWHTKPSCLVYYRAIVEHIVNTYPPFYL